VGCVYAHPALAVLGPSPRWGAVAYLGCRLGMVGGGGIYTKKYFIDLKNAYVKIIPIGYYKQEYEKLKKIKMGIWG